MLFYEETKGFLIHAARALVKILYVWRPNNPHSLFKVSQSLNQRILPCFICLSYTWRELVCMPPMLRERSRGHFAADSRYGRLILCKGHKEGRGGRESSFWLKIFYSLISNSFKTSSTKAFQISEECLFQVKKLSFVLVFQLENCRPWWDSILNR